MARLLPLHRGPRERRALPSLDHGGRGRGEVTLVSGGEERVVRGQAHDLEVEVILNFEIIMIISRRKPLLIEEARKAQKRVVKLTLGCSKTPDPSTMSKDEASDGEPLSCNRFVFSREQVIRDRIISTTHDNPTLA